MATEPAYIGGVLSNVTDKKQEVDAGPISYGIAVTPSDSVDLTNPCRGIYVGVSGNVAVVLAGGETVTFVNLVAGVLHGIRATRILSTGTTATSIVAVR